MDDDGTLIRRYLDGDAGAFDSLVRRHSPALFAFLLWRMRDRHRAEDVLQDTFLRMLTHLEKYRHSGRLRAWLFSIARNLATDAERTAGAGRLVSTESGPGEGMPTVGDLLPAPESSRPDVTAERLEAYTAARSAVAELPAQQREVFLMRSAGLSFREIGRIQRVPLNTALGRMHDAVTRLRKRLKTEET